MPVIGCTQRPRNAPGLRVLYVSLSWAKNLMGLLIAALLLWACSTPTLDSFSLSNSVESQLDPATEPQGSFRVACPVDVPAEAGYRFQCSIIPEVSVRWPATWQKVSVEVLNEAGHVFVVDG